MNKRIIVAMLVLVNASTASLSFGASRIDHQELTSVINWVENTGKDRDDLVGAEFLDLKSAAAKSKARGTPAGKEEFERYVHLVLKKGNPYAVVLIRMKMDESRNWASEYFKIDLKGKLQRAIHVESRTDSAGQIVKGSSKASDMPLDKATQPAQAELSYWSGRAKSEAPSAPPVGAIP